MASYSRRTASTYLREGVKPTKSMRAAAKWALKVRSEAPPSKRAGTAVGIARARDLANGRPLSKATLRRIRNYINRAAGTADAAPARDEQGHVPKSKQALGLWGARRGKAVAEWADRKLRNMSEAKTPAPKKDRIKGSKKNPKGSASDSRGGITIDDAAEQGLKNKLEAYDGQHKIDLGMLKAVYRRGAGAFSTSHRPGMTRNQWAMARVNTFIRLVKTGKRKKSYTTDLDLLPKTHPQSTRK